MSRTVSNTDVPGGGVSSNVNVNPIQHDKSKINTAAEAFAAVGQSSVATANKKLKKSKERLDTVRRQLNMEEDAGELIDYFHQCRLRRCIAPMMVLLQRNDHMVLEFRTKTQAKSFFAKKGIADAKTVKLHFGSLGVSSVCAVATVTSNSPSVISFDKAVQKKESQWYESSSDGVVVGLEASESNLPSVSITLCQGDLVSNNVAVWSNRSVDYKTELARKGMTQLVKPKFIGYCLGLLNADQGTTDEVQQLQLLVEYNK